MKSSTQIENPPPQKSPSVHLSYLDGLRGLAALYVTMFHAQSIVFGHGTVAVPKLITASYAWMRYGRYSVAVFIVLSGYCLMLPVARSANGQLRGGAWEYLKRRAKRILPPYYIALAVSLLVIALVPGMNIKRGAAWDYVLPAFDPANLVSHVLLLHNLRPDWLLKINGSLWSVATEWHIYFFLPFVLLPIWRRAGLIVTVIAAFAIGLAPKMLWGGYYDGAAPWFLGLFAIGMAGAVISHSTEERFAALRSKAPFEEMAFTALGIFVAIALLMPSWVFFDAIWVMDIIVGLFAVNLILACDRMLRNSSTERQPFIIRLLSGSAVVKLGAFSYSLYLLHAPILGIVELVIHKMGLSPVMQYAVLMLVGVPLCIVGAYVFYLGCERPFTTWKKASSPSAAPAQSVVAPPIPRADAGPAQENAVA